ncbi:MAG: hypothetical protein ACK551_07905 [Vampirovibrionales bacterium]
MNSIQPNGYPYPLPAQSQMNVASTPTQGGLQENQVAFTEDEARVLQQMIRAGVVSAAVVGMSRKTELNTSSLGALGILQPYWQDDDRLNNLGYKLKGYGDRIDANAVNRFYLNKDGKTGRDIWGATTKKNGFILTDSAGKPINPKSTNIAESASGKPLFTTDMHTVDADGKVLKMTKAQNGFPQKFGNAMPNIKYDNRGTFGDSKIGGHAGPVAESASQYAKQLRELENLKVAQNKTSINRGSNGIVIPQKRDSLGQIIPRTPEELTALKETKAARATKIAAAQKQYLALDQIRLEEASKALKQQQNVLAIEKAALESAKAKPNFDASKLTNQEARVAKLEQMVQAQKEHVIKLNRKNAQFVAANTVKNIDTLAEQIMKDPNWRQKGANPFNAKGAKTTQLDVLLADHGFNSAQKQAIQEAAEKSPDAVKKALKEAIKANQVNVNTIATGLDAGEAALKTTVDAKAAAGGVRNTLGIAGKVTKGLAIVGTALEVLNFGNNMKNGDHRKAAADLTTAVITGAGTALLAGMLFSGVGTLPALAISAAIGMGMSAGVAPLVDKGYKALGLTNQNERDAQKAKIELQQFNQTLASAPTAMATA